MTAFLAQQALDSLSEVKKIGLVYYSLTSRVAPQGSETARGLSLIRATIQVLRLPFPFPPPEVVPIPCTGLQDLPRCPRKVVRLPTERRWLMLITNLLSLAVESRIETFCPSA